MRGYAIPGTNRGLKFLETLSRVGLRSGSFSLSKFAVIASMVAGLFTFVPNAAIADSVNDMAQVCSGCHGENGVPIDKSIPVIWGQRREYILKQLLDFKTGHRKNETMAGIVESLTKADMEALATYFSEQKWPKLEQPPAPADVAHQAQEVFSAMNCRGCHQDHFQGDYVRPSLRGQQEDYLLKTMTDFHTGERNNYPGMVALMKVLNEDQLKPVAAYLAGLAPEVPVAGE